MPLLSVIVPIYNKETYLSICIDSILEQSFANFELLLINDGSSDGSLAICKSYEKKDKRIKVYDKENGGASSAKNFGIKRANGVFCSFVDADDYIDKDFFRNLINKIENNKIDLAIGNVLFVDENKNTTRNINLVEGDFSLRDFFSFFPLYMPNAIIGAPWNKIYRVSILKKNNILFDESITNNEDLHFNINYFYFCKSVSVVGYPLYHYINHCGTSLSRKYISNLFDIYLLSFNKMCAFLESINMLESNKKFYYSYFAKQIINAVDNACKDNGKQKKDKIVEIDSIVNNNITINLFSEICFSDLKNKILSYLVRKKRKKMLYYYFQFRNVVRK